MADIMTLKKFEALGPFEIKNELINLAKATSKTAQSAFLDAGRGNPNWVATTPREGFFLLGQFAITESKRTMEEISWDRWHATGQRHRGSPRRMAREAHGYARCRRSALYGEVRDQDFRVRSRCIRPRARRFDHWRPLSGARSHAGPQRAHRARVFNVGDVRKAAPFWQVRPLRGRRRHRRDVLHLQIAEGQPIAVSRRLRSRSARRSSRPTSR